MQKMLMQGQQQSPQIIQGKGKSQGTISERDQKHATKKIAVADGDGIVLLWSTGNQWLCVFQVQRSLPFYKVVTNCSAMRSPSPVHLLFDTNSFQARSRDSFVAWSKYGAASGFLSFYSHDRGLYYPHKTTRVTIQSTYYEVTSIIILLLAH